MRRLFNVAEDDGVNTSFHTAESEPAVRTVCLVDFVVCEDLDRPDGDIGCCRRDLGDAGKSTSIASPSIAARYRCTSELLFFFPPPRRLLP